MIQRQVSKGRLKDPVKIAQRVGRWHNKFKVARYFQVEIAKGRFNYWLNKEELKLTKKLAGCYVVVTTVPKDQLAGNQVVEYYRSLTLVDRAFRIIKSTLLNIRPIYHYRGRRVIAHAFICMLSLYLVTELRKRLKSLFGENGTGRNYTLTLHTVLDELEQIKMGAFQVKGINIQRIKPLSPLQKKILQSLGIELKCRH